MTKVVNVGEFANDLLHANICAIPCTMPSKRPSLNSWTEFQHTMPAVGQHQFNGALGVITGKISGNMFVIDLDVKYDLTGTLVERLQKEIGDELYERIFQAAYIQKTVNNGLHIFLRCEQIEGNQKLARRYATEEERRDNPDEKVKVLLETRGEGGFIVVAPTPGYTAMSGSLQEVGFISVEDKERLFECCRSFNEVFQEVNLPTSKRFTSTLTGVPPWEDYNQRADVPSYLQSQGWTFFKKVGKNLHFTRPGKRGSTSGTYHEDLNLFRCFTTSSPLESDKSYSPAALFTFLECGGNFEEAARRLRSMGYGSKEHHGGTDNTFSFEIPSKKKDEQKYFKDYIIRQEPVQEVPVLLEGGVTLLSHGNILTVFGPPKAMKTRYAKAKVNQSKLRTGYIDTEQGAMHAWLTSKSMPTADLYHMRGQDQAEIQRVAWEIAESGEYELLVIDNIRDAACLDFNDTVQAANMELFLKRISLKIPVVCIAHQNKNSKSISGHMGNALEKISQTMVHCQLSDAENPAMGALVTCYRSRDEPFRQCLITPDGQITSDSFVKSAGKSMLLADVIAIIGGREYTRKELNETYADLFSISETTAANELSKLKRAHPGLITERKEGKTKIFFISSSV